VYRSDTTPIERRAIPNGHRATSTVMLGPLGEVCG
jgi:hypothetical protein